MNSEPERDERRPPPSKSPVIRQSGGSIVGGLPFATPASAPASPPTAGASRVATQARPPAAGKPRQIATVTPQRSRPTVVRDPGAAALAEIKALIIRSIARVHRPSPAFLASFGMHVLVLLSLAMIVIRAERPRVVRLEMRFGDAGPAGEDLGSIESPAESVDPPSPPVAPATEPTKAMTNPEEPEVDPDPQPPGIATSDGGDSSARAPVESLLGGRSDSGRAEGLSASGGDDETERAVAMALDWIARQQQKSGLWSLEGPYTDGGNQENQLAATAMALLALQGAGTSDANGRYADSVRLGWEQLLSRQRPDGTFDAGPIPDQHSMYSHAQTTIAICEASAMAADPKLRERLASAAKRSVEYAVASQMPDGGWRYSPPDRSADKKGDMSVTGWFLMALRTAEMAGMSIPQQTYDRLNAFLDAVHLTEESGICVDERNMPTDGYGYQILPTQKVFVYRPALAAEGLLCRQHLGWDRDDPRITAGVRGLLERSPINFRHRGKNVYAWYYQTQVFHNLGGDVWERWNDVMRKELPREQVTSGREKGSWETTYDQWGSTAGGRLYMTTLLTLMLESYYRHLPVYQRVSADP